LPRFPFTNAGMVNALHAHGISVIVWDCNTVRDLRLAMLWDVDGIITDFPNVLKEELRAAPKK